MAESLIGILLETVNSLIGKRIGKLLGVNREMEKFSSLLSAICAVLKDAEEKQLTDRAITDWLQKLSDVSSELEDVLDDCELEAYKMQNQTWTGKLRSSLNVKFRIKIANKMKEIGNRLDEIANERTRFHLRESVGETTLIRGTRRTSTSIPEPHVYGREDDREKVVDFLVNDAAKCKEISVFAIAGLGGLGKTTLAKYVFNDERVSKHFELKMWVCVSENFDLKRLVKEIIESATATGCEALEIDPLQKRLQEVLRGKRFLLVLDDVWNEDREEWEKLKYGLTCGSTGSSLVVTTRLKTVGSIMGTVPMHDLSGLSEDNCWSLFKQRAFGCDGEEQPNLVKIGKKIVKKCRGVPLAAKALGGLLFFKKDEREWYSVLQNEIWHLPEEKVKILPELRLSYFQLPLEQRRCFAYCAIFPKGYQINKQQLIHLWMANGLISSTRGLEMEDIGNEIFDELCWISFMQEEKSIYQDFSYFKMHDLVHDLAQSIMKEECQFLEILDTANPVNLSKRVRHLTCFSISATRIEIPSAESLRTFLFLGHGIYGCSYLFKFRSLRAFDVEYMESSMCTSSLIGKMKHLRYLNISNSNIEIVPESVCSLRNLLTLDLNCCFKLRKLPKRLNQLTELRHLYNHCCPKLSYMPSRIEQLTCLRTLTSFIVSRKKGCGLDTLGCLDIGGSLEIKNLEKVRSPLEAKSANLLGKKNLKRLDLFWNARNEKESQDIAEEVLEALVSPPNLSVLSIHNYKGGKLANWMSYKILGNVTSTTLSNCKNVVKLPPWGNLPSLRDLSLSGMNFVQYLDDQRYNGQSKRCFVQLKNLWLNDLPNLEKLSREEGSEMFPCLSKLIVQICPKLMLSRSESVQQLVVYDVTELLLNTIRNLCGLIHILLGHNDCKTYLPGGMLKTLTNIKSLSIHSFTKLQEFSGDMLIGCSTLERLEIISCNELEFLPDGIFRSSSSLKDVTIRECKKLKSLSGDFGQLVALQRLNINLCDELKFLSDGIFRSFCCQKDEIVARWF